MTLNPFTLRPVLKTAKPPRQLPPADQFLRDHALREEGARSVLAALKPLLKSCVTLTADGRRVIPAEIVEALLSGNGKPSIWASEAIKKANKKVINWNEVPEFVRKCEKVDD